MLKNIFTKAPLFPFLFALYPFVHLVSVNFSQIEPLAGLRTIIIMFIICLIAFLFFFALTHSLQHSGLRNLFSVNSSQKYPSFFNNLMTCQRNNVFRSATPR